MITDTLSIVAEGVDLDRGQAIDAMMEMMSGNATQAQMGALLMAMKIKGLTVDELVGFVRAMQDCCVEVSVPPGAIDLCGTGGDHSGSFNISTVSSFIVAACGVPVAKHGNRSISSSSGSADVLEALHIPIDLGPEEVQACIAETGVGFLFAPYYHSSMGNVASVRREIRFRTVFNLLGPLTNPARVKRQVIGVYDISVAPLLAACMKELGSEHVMFVNGCGMDEITLSGGTRVVELKDGKVSEYTVFPEDMGLEIVDSSAFKGEGPPENARTMMSILNGERSARRDVVLANAAAGLYVAGKAKSLAEGVELSGEAIDSGKAMAKLKEYSRKASEMDALRQFSMGINDLMPRRVQPSVMVQRSPGLVAAMLDALRERGEDDAIDCIDPLLLRFPNILTILVLSRLLFSDKGEQSPPRGGKLSDAIRSESQISLIAEYKPSSPSIVPPYVHHPLNILNLYQKSAAAISVLGERKYFKGGAELFSKARAAVEIPMLYKDFLVTEGQLRDAAALGANAVLLIAKALRTEQLATMVESAISLGMEPLVELHDTKDLFKLENSGAVSEVEMIGVNCRDLCTLTTAPGRFGEMRERLPKGVLAIAESGLVSDDFRPVEGYDAVLIGNRFMHSSDPAHELNRAVTVLRGSGA